MSIISKFLFVLFVLFFVIPFAVFVIDTELFFILFVLMCALLVIPFVNKR